MKQKEIEYAVIKNAINILCVLCAADRNTLINTLIGILWDQEEAFHIKAASTIREGTGISAGMG